MNKDNRIKILMYGKHFAYIDSKIQFTFEHQCRVVNFAAWIREQAYKDFGIQIKDVNDIEILDEFVKECCYSDKTEWLREKMRNQIKEIELRENEKK